MIGVGAADLNNISIGWDPFISRELAHFLYRFQHIPVLIPLKDLDEVALVQIHPPYMMQSVSLINDKEAFNKLKERHQNRLINVRRARESAPKATRLFLETQFFTHEGTEVAVANGRATIEDIRKLTQDAVDAGLVPAVEMKPTSGGIILRHWLKKFGIGVDCSGFVQEALSWLSVACLKEASRNESGNKSWSAVGLSSKFPLAFLRCLRVYQDVMIESGESVLFSKVPFPLDARPGDILVSKSHMRIVVRKWTLIDGSVQLDLAESTSARDIPFGSNQFETDIGPRLIQINYPKPALPIYDQDPLRKGLHQHTFEFERGERQYVIGRHHALGQFFVATPRFPA